MQIKGRCPGLHEPMPARDGLLIRLFPPSPDITAAQLSQMFEGAHRYGNGIVQLTSRGNLQLRGFTENTLRMFRSAMIEAGLSEPTLVLERARRAVIASPLRGLDPCCASETSEIAEQMVRWLAQSAIWESLPAKFRIVIDGGSASKSAIFAGGIVAKRLQKGWRVAYSDTVADGLTVSEIVPYVTRMVSKFAPRRSEVKRSDEPNIVDDTANLPNGPLLGEWQVYGVPLGILKPRILIPITESGASVRLLPNRMVLAKVGLQDATLVTEGDAPQLRVFACVGQAACAHATTDTTHDARDLMALLPPGKTLHVSGCEKGCAHPGKADITLIGRDGYYDMVRGGTARDNPQEERLLLASIRGRVAFL